MTNIIKKKGWIEFPIKGKKNPKRYARRRMWEKDEKGNWKKRLLGRADIPPMTESEYQQYKKQLARAKRARGAK